MKDYELKQWEQFAATHNIQCAKFYPVGPLNGKRNFKRFFRIEREGSIIERVFLDVTDLRHRETLICLHYLRHLAHNFLRYNIGVNIIGRDKPWDFKLELSTGRTFHLEITSIADNPHHFEINKREERFTRWCLEETIPLHELRKLLLLFPDKRVSDLVDDYQRKDLARGAMVPNPFYLQGARLFLSTLSEPTDRLDVLLKRVITRKVEKQHNEKENTVLIIDNRTGAFDVPDYFEACEKIGPFVATTPFPEVWFYTGYYSNDDGNDAEFSFSPIKVTPEQRVVLDEMARSGNIDESGRYVW